MAQHKAEKGELKRQSSYMSIETSSKGQQCTLSSFLPFSNTKSPLPQVTVLGGTPHRWPGLFPVTPTEYQHAALCAVGHHMLSGLTSMCATGQQSMWPET